MVIQTGAYTKKNGLDRICILALLLEIELTAISPSVLFYNMIWKQRCSERLAG